MNRVVFSCLGLLAVVAGCLGLVVLFHSLGSLSADVVLAKLGRDIAAVLCGFHLLSRGGEGR